MPDSIKPANEKLFEHKEELMELAQDKIPKAITSIGKFADEMERLPQRLEPALESTGQLNKTLHDIPGVYEAEVHVTTYYHGGDPGQGSEFQHGGIVPGPIGAPRQATVHGGEIILNPYEVGAMGGPGGPSPPGNSSTSYGGDTFVTTINDRLSGAMFMEEMRSRERYDQLSNRM